MKVNLTSRWLIRLICFIFLLELHVIDIISTVIGLNMGFIESNPITKHLFELGSVGVVFEFIYFISIIIIIFLIIEGILMLYKPMTKREIPLAVIWLVYIMITTFLAVGILSAIINNFILIFS